MRDTTTQDPHAQSQNQGSTVHPFGNHRSDQQSSRPRQSNRRPGEMIKTMRQANTTHFCLITVERPSRKANAFRCFRKNKVYCLFELIEVRLSLKIADVYTLQLSHDGPPIKPASSSPHLPARSQRRTGRL